MSSRTVRILLSGLALAGFLHAAETAPAKPEASPASPADFSSGLKKLTDLGIPSFEGAKWVQANTLQQLLMDDEGSYRGISYSLRQLSDDLDGHYWVRRDGKEGLSVAAPGTPAVVDVGGKTPRFLRDVPEEFRKQMLTQMMSQVDSAKPRKIADTVTKTIAKMEKTLAGEKKENETRNYSSNQYGPAVGGEMLIFAAQIYASGETSEANRLAAAVFKNWPDRQAVLNGAIAVLAERQYDEISGVFFKSGDWAGYAKSLRALQAKFPRGWDKRAGLAILIARVEKRAAGKPAPFKPEGVPKPDAATLAAFDALVDAKPDEKQESRDTSVWLLPEVGKKKNEGMFSFGRHYFGGSSPFLGESSVVALRKPGVAALPVLIAALGDETLVRLRNGSPSYSFSSSSDSAETKARRSYEQLKRPATRGEIARELLFAVLPGETYKLRRLDADGLASAATDFLAEHGKDKPLDFARFYLKEGSDEQKQAAMNFFARSDDPAAGKEFEASLLASENIEGETSQAIEYVKSKKGAASDFAKKLVAKLRENLKTVTDRPKQEWSSSTTNGVTTVSKPQLEKVIAQLEAFTSGKSTREIVLDALKQAKKPAAELNRQGELIRAMDAKDRDALYLELAADSEDKALRAAATQQLAYGNLFMQPDSEKKSFTPPAADTPDGKRWRKLLASTVIVPGNVSVSLGKLAAYAVENRADKVPQYVTMMMYVGDGSDYILVRRAEARFAGKEVPAYPDPSKVTAERLGAIAAQVLATPDAKYGDYLAGLSPDERYAFVLWRFTRMSPSQSAYLGTKLAEITAPAGFDAKDNAFAGTGSELMGKKMSAEERALAEEIIGVTGLKTGTAFTNAGLLPLGAALAGNHAKYSGVTVICCPALDGLGRKLYASRAKIAKFEMSGGFDNQEDVMIYSAAQKFRISGDNGAKGADALVSLQVESEAFNGARLWKVKGDKVSPPEAPGEKDAKKPVSYAVFAILDAKDAKVITPEAFSDKSASADADADSDE